MKQSSAHLAYTQAKRSKVSHCACCLYRIGLGIQRVSVIIGKPKATVFKWIRREGFLDSERAMRGNSKRMANTMVSDAQRAAFMDEFKAWRTHEKSVQWKSNTLINRRAHESRMATPHSRAMFYARKRIRHYCKQAGIKKTFRATSVIGCDSITLEAHIRLQFRSGMTWANHGKHWEIDHIVPLASAKTVEDVQRLSHYTNLQPLLVTQNRLKSDRLDWLMYIPINTTPS